MNGARVWLFDLDNTLHDANPHIFPQINQAMTDYVAHHLDVPTAEANRLRQRYWEKYGATLTGLIRHHGINPHHFLWHTHQFPDLRQQLVCPPGLHGLLRSLPGRKIVFSNAPSHYTNEILAVLGIAGDFDSVWCLEHLRFTPKPFRSAFRRLLHRERLTPQRCIMVEDSAENLKTAKALGMTTVLVGPPHRRPPWVDLWLPDVLALGRQTHRLGFRSATR